MNHRLCQNCRVPLFAWEPSVCKPCHRDDLDHFEGMIILSRVGLRILPSRLANLLH